MKHITALFAVISGVVLTLTINASAQSVQPGLVTVVRIAGEARYSLGDQNWHPLVAGKYLPAGAVIQTGHDATVDLVLGKKVMMPQASPVPNRISVAADADVRGLVAFRPSAEQNVIRMTGDTVLAVDKLTVSDTGVDTVSDTELDLRQGRIYCSVKKLSGASQYLIKIPNGIAGVRGTLFVIDASGFVGVFQHSVVLSIIGSDGKPSTVVVPAGQEFNPQSGTVAPLPPDFSTMLGQLFPSLRTMYYEDVSFTFDRTLCHISPTSGSH